MRYFSAFPLLWSALALSEPIRVVGIVHSSEIKNSIALVTDDAWPPICEDPFDLWGYGYCSQRTVGLRLFQMFSGYKLISIEPRFVVFEKDKIRITVMSGDYFYSEDYEKIRRKDVRSKTMMEEIEKRNDAVILSSQYRDHLVGPQMLSSIMMQAASEPHYDSLGALDGFSLWDIEKDSVYEKIGLKNGDIIKALNGIELRDVSTTIKLLFSLKGENSVEIRVVRDSVEKTILVRIE